MVLRNSAASTSDRTQLTSRFMPCYVAVDLKEGYLADECRAYEILHLNAAERMVIAEPDLLPNVVDPALKYGIPKERILAFGDDLKDGHQSWRTLVSHSESDWPRFNDLETARNTTLARLFFSGTTGLPKAANVSHCNLIAEYRLFTKWTPTPWQSRRIIILPMFHAAIVPLAHYASLRSGDPSFIAECFELELSFRLVEEYQVTGSAFVPPMVAAIINSPLKDKYSLQSIRIAHGGAVPLDRWPKKSYKHCSIQTVRSRKLGA